MITSHGLAPWGPTGQARRRNAAALAVVYALAVWALPFAHAVLLDGAGGPGVHVERQGTRDHREAHDSLDCTIFSAARLVSAAPSSVAIPDGGRDVSSIHPLESEGPRLAAARGAHGSRAPPLA